MKQTNVIQKGIQDKIHNFKLAQKINFTEFNITKESYKKKNLKAYLM